MPSVLMISERLCVLQLTTWTYLSVLWSRTESLMPRAYCLPKPNSLPWAMKRSVLSS